MKKTLNYFIVVGILSVLSACNQSEGITEEAPVVDTTSSYPIVPETNSTNSSVNYDLKHKYSYVKLLEDGSYVFGMLDLYTDNDYTQAISVNRMTQSGRGTFTVNGNTLSLHKTSGIAIDGDLSISKGDNGKLWLTLSNGVTYVEDDEGYFIKNVVVTPGTNIRNSETNANVDNSEEMQEPQVLSFEGTATDEQSGIAQNYTLNVKSDMSAASIGGGPYTSIENQGNGIYMWVDGTIIGMSFKMVNDRCVLYGSEGDYFCTLYRK